MSYSGYGTDGLISEKFVCLRLPVFVSSVLFCDLATVLLEGMCVCVCSLNVGVLK